MALDYFAPGVYVEEVDRGSRPIEGISMSVAGFIGLPRIYAVTPNYLNPC